MANTLPLDSLSAVGEPRLLLCDKKSCSKKQACAFKKLTRAAERAEVTVELVGCQGACSGPTAVVIDENGPSWFQNLQKPKARADIIALASAEISKPTKRLKKRQLKGKQRKRAAKKLAKQLHLSPKVRP